MAKLLSTRKLYVPLHPCVCVCARISVVAAVLESRKRG